MTRGREAFIVGAMLLGGAAPSFLLYALLPSVLGIILGGVLFWPFALGAGALALPR